MDSSAESLQAQQSFTTNGNAAPTAGRNSRCSPAVRTGVGTFTFTTAEDVAAGSCDYSLAASLDAGGVPVVVNIKKTAAFTWAISTSQVAVVAAAQATTWKGSGNLPYDGGGGAVVGFVADTNATIVGTNAIKYPLGHSATSVLLSIFVTANTFVSGIGPLTGITTFTVVKNGIDTLLVINVAPGAVGLFTVQLPAVAWVAGDTFDVRVNNPGDGPVPHTMEFGASMDFSNAAAPAQLTVADTIGSVINLTLRRVDPM